MPEKDSIVSILLSQAGFIIVYRKFYFFNNPYVNNITSIFIGLYKKIAEKEK